MPWRSLTPLQALYMLFFTHLKRFNDHPERARFDATRKSPKTEQSPGMLREARIPGLCLGSRCQPDYP